MPCHKPVFWFGQMILPFRSRRFLLYTFEPLALLIMKAFSITLDILNRPDAQFQSRWFQRLAAPRV
ncbi:MAG: hypothetical protein U0936_12315 [Planctomycetaceae bacterium]